MEYAELRNELRTERVSLDERSKLQTWDHDLNDTSIHLCSKPECSRAVHCKRESVH